MSDTSATKPARKGPRTVVEHVPADRFGFGGRSASRQASSESAGAAGSASAPDEAASPAEAAPAPLLQRRQARYPEALHRLGLGHAPVDHGARRGDLGPVVVSRVRLAHVQRAVPPHGPVRVPPVSHGLGGDAKGPRDGFVPPARVKHAGGPLPERPVVPASQVDCHGKASRLPDFYFRVQEMGGSSNNARGYFTRADGSPPPEAHSMLY